MVARNDFVCLQPVKSCPLKLITFNEIFCARHFQNFGPLKSGPVPKVPPGPPLNGPETKTFAVSQTSIHTSVVVETTCFETKTAKFYRDQDRSSFETFGSRPRPEIIETKTKTGNYLASKNIFISPSLINLFFIFPKN